MGICGEENKRGKKIFKGNVDSKNLKDYNQNNKNNNQIEQKATKNNNNPNNPKEKKLTLEQKIYFSIKNCFILKRKIKSKSIMQKEYYYILLTYIVQQTDSTLSS